MKTLTVILLLTLAGCSTKPVQVKQLQNDYEQGVNQLAQAERLLCNANKEAATLRYNTANSRMAYIKLCEAFARGNHD